jgi:hypothetical protein
MRWERNMGEGREGNKNTKSYNREEKIEMIFPIIFDYLS